MNYWRFRASLVTKSVLDKRMSGQSVITKGIPQSSKDMIAKRKKLTGRL